MSTHRPRSLHRLRLVALAVVAALGLVGCTSQLPTIPEPQPGLPVSVQARPDVDRLLTPPQPGASPADVVRGFLRANVGFADERDVARTYLTEGLASQWVPTQEILVYEGTPDIVDDGSRTVAVDVRVAGRIDDQGQLVEQGSASAITQSFSLARVDGEWRINGFPDGFGVWLSRTDLEQSFRPTSLYYLNPHGSTFVPEIRWLAAGEGRPTAVTRAQLGPMPDHLDGALRTGATEEVRLTVPSVPVDPSTGLATVSLSGSGLAAGDGRTRALQSQIAHALLGLTGVSAVDVQVAGQTLPMGEQDGPLTASTELPYHDVQRNVDLLLLRVGERFTPIDPALYDLRNLPPERAAELTLPRLGLSWTGVAATADLTDFAAVSTDRTSLWRWRDGTEFVNPGIGDGLTPPAVDPLGGFWVAGISRSSGGPRFWVLDGGDLRAGARPIDVPWLAERDRVQTLSISPDGSRAIMVVGDATSDRRRLVLAGIERDADGRALGLTPGVPVAPSLSLAVSARWATVSDLYLVGQRPDDPRPRAFSLRLGEWLTPLGSRDALSPVEVLAVPRGTGTEPIARTADGRFHVTEGAQGWAPARNGDEIVVPGS